MTRRIKGVKMDATVKLEGIEVKPKTSIRVLGLMLDSKLNWNAHLRKVQAKMDNQMQALHCVAGSMWGAVLPVSRLVYAAVVRPAMTFAAPIWHSPKNTPGAVGKHVKTLTTIQNKGLRKVLGAYKATPIPVLEAEAGIPSVRDFLDKALLRSKILRGTHETVLKGNAKIKSRLQPKVGVGGYALRYPRQLRRSLGRSGR